MPVRGFFCARAMPGPDDTKDGARCPFPIYRNLILCCGDRNLRAHFLDTLALDPRRDDADAIGGAGDHMAPRIDDERMSIGRARLVADLMQRRSGRARKNRSPSRWRGRGREPPNGPCR